MKRVFLCMFLLMGIILGSNVHAAFLAPYLDITVHESSIDGDGSFGFQIHAYGRGGSATYFNKNFNIQTSSGAGSNFTGAGSGYGDSYYITQDSVAGWQSPSVECVSDNPSVTFSLIDGGILIRSFPYSSVNCYFTNKKSSSKTPVLIVPGILGTEMKKGEEFLWVSPLRMGNPLNQDSFMDPLQFKPDLSPSDSGVYSNEVLENPAGKFDYTKSLVEEFKKQGYTQGQGSGDNLFLFPYDWRYGVSGKYPDGRTNVDLLKEKIFTIKNQTGSDKVDIIAHSMGGLVVKKYVIDNANSHSIGKAVFVGVPNLGAPKALKTLIQGDSFDVFGLSDQEMKKISENLPMSYELLPSQEYVNKNGSYARTVTAQYLFSNKQDLDYSQTKDLIINDHKLNSLASNNAESLHTTSFDKYDLRNNGIDLYSIIGCKSGTTGHITERRIKEQISTSVVGYALDNVSGDGTVPLESAESLRVSSDHLFYVPNAEHGKMLSADGIKQAIVSIVKDGSVQSGDKIFTHSEVVNDISKCGLTGHSWDMHSPVSVEVVDQNGNRAGIAADGSVQNDIPGADYEMMGDQKFIFVPTDKNQTYQVNLAGTGTGTFTFRDSIIENDKNIQTEVFSNLPVTPSLSGTVNIDALNNTTLTIQASSASTPTLINPSSIIKDKKVGDVIAPVSTSTLFGLMGDAGFYRGDVKINLSAVDPIIPGQENETSGLLKIKYSLDGGEYKDYNSTSIIVVSSEGQHTISFFSTDNAGNNEPEQIVAFTIDKTAPEFIVQFNPVNQDLDFTATDTSSTALSTSTLVSLNSKGFNGFALGRLPKVKDLDDVIIATDSAGNTTQINLKSKDAKHQLKADIKSIIYNGKAADISKNLLHFDWVADKKGNIQILTQQVQSKKDFNILAVYGLNRTIITGKDQGEKLLKTLNGLVILKVSTAQGDLAWSY